MDIRKCLEAFQDPVFFVKFCWPHIRLYDKQVEIMESVRDNDETIVPAGNMLGKDFVSGLIVLWYFCSRSPCRIITSSAGQSQLKSVLWGEIRGFLATSRVQLPIEVIDMAMFQGRPDGTRVEKSYVKGIVTNTPENLQGHHLARGPNPMLRHLVEQGILREDYPNTLAIFDEASGIGDEYWNASETWSHRRLVIGNPLPCTNFFYRAVEEGDILRDDEPGYIRKVIQIKGIHSPNVLYGMKIAEKFGERIAAKKPQIVPGVISYNEYRKRRKTWDIIKQTVGLDAEFYKGAEVKLYPPDWMATSADLEERVKSLRQKGGKNLKKSMGVDTAEGGDDTVWTVVDCLGIIDQISMKTRNTAYISNKTLALMRRHEINAGSVFFDRGGGGKEHADYLRQKGHEVHTVAFGESANYPHEAREFKDEDERTDIKETRSIYKNRRAEMYGLLRNWLNPELIVPPDEEEKDPTAIAASQQIFCVPNKEKYQELLRQMKPMPLLYDAEGRMYLPPKSKPNDKYNGDTITDMIGRSPDQLDSLVLAVYAHENSKEPTIVGPMF